MTTPETPSFDIVISYRRDDTQATSNAIYRELVRRFGAERVLLDITSIPVGEDYDQFVRKIIGKAKAVILVIGPQWLTTEKRGARRLDDEGDAVRGEVLAALAANVTLIPLLVDGATAIEADALPAPLRPLARLNMLPIFERYWDTDMETLAKRLSPLLGIEAESVANKKSAESSNKRPWIVAAAVFAIAALAAGWFYFPTAREPIATVPATKTGMQASPAGEASHTAQSPEKKVVAVKIPLARRPLAMTMIHDTGKPRNYTAVYVIDNNLYYGAASSLSNRTLGDLLHRYADSPNARFAAQVREYLPRLQARDTTLVGDIDFKKLLVRVAGEDPVMTRLQDQMLQDGYFEPARKECTDIGIASALGYALIADTYTQGGYRSIKQATTQALDGTPITGIDEHDWLREFAKQRVARMASLQVSDAVRKSVQEQTRRRTDTYTKLMDMNKWDLAAPVPVAGFVLVDP